MKLSDLKDPRVVLVRRDSHALEFVGRESELFIV